MSDLPKVEIYTYESKNAPPAMAWLAYIWTEDAGKWHLSFQGASEEGVKGKASAFYEDIREKREAAIRNREEAKRKAAETRARKKKLVG